ncbi:MAG: right-handed parallel beta-helix repeat-containing protein [Phycisphaerales bacterium]
MIEVLAAAVLAADLPVVVVDRDDVEIRESCVVRIPEGVVIVDDEGDGVIKIAASGVTVRFEAGAELVGRGGIDGWLRAGGGAWDTLTGTGVVVEGQSMVTLEDVRVRGYRVGVRARDAAMLTIRDASLRDLWRQRLGSTARREDSADWIYPHHNDANEWLERYGAAVWVEDSRDVTIEDVRVRRGQNGIVLDATNDSRVRGCDASFLSGWGLAMWRASSNTIERNRFDFCVRGHVEGVYNRGQDSAGILMFEQCAWNDINHNSCTHSGDGIFGFGGNDALGQTTDEPWGNANNRFMANDLSFAPAHGLEMTFSEGNVIVGNLFEENAICGIWGGYSRGMRIQDNRLARNGGMAYGGERGGINIEHGSNNRIITNLFENNRCGVRLWWDHDEGLLAMPGVAHAYRGVSGNTVAGNAFVMNGSHPFGDAGLVGIEVLDLGAGVAFEGPRVGENRAAASGNTWEIEDGVGERVRVSDGVALIEGNASGSWSGPWSNAVPVRRSPAGREWIVVDAWGPWDFGSPMLRVRELDGARHEHELFLPPDLRETVQLTRVSGDVRMTTGATEGPEAWRPTTISFEPEEGVVVAPYEVVVRVGDWSRTLTGTLVRAAWDVRAWAWDADPETDRDAWRAEAGAIEAVMLDRLDLPFAYGGPARASDGLGVEARDGFGLIAETEIALPAGTWRVRTTSDDGILVVVNGEPVIERWDVHGPTPDEAAFEVAGDAPTAIRVEYFERDGYATLGLAIEPAY